VTCFSELKSAILTVDTCCAGLVPNVGRQQNFNFFHLEKIRKGEKNDFFFILMPQRNSVTELAFSKYPHKLQNLSFNLKPFFYVLLRTMKISRKQMVQGLYAHPVLSVIIR
jgi:hypothetical protein